VRFRRRVSSSPRMIRRSVMTRAPNSPRSFRGRLDQVVLRPDRLMLVWFSDGRRGTNSVEFTFTSGLIRACKRRVRADGARRNVADVAGGIVRGADELPGTVA
jgi:hypothetical protein